MQKIWRKVAPFKYWLLLIIIIPVAFLGYSHYTKNKSRQAVTNKTVTVEQGSITAEVSATGTIKPVNMVDVSSKITGLIKDVKVQENQPVKAGDIIMILDDTHLKALVSQAEARLANASANYDRNKSLNAIGAISHQQLDAARMDYDVARAAYEDAVAQLADTIIRAPISGTVIGKPIPAGQTVSPGISTPMILATVADMTQMQIETQVDESDIGKVKLGDKVNFTVDAYSGKTFQGVVANISQRATIQQNVVYYSVLVNVTATDNLLKPTMTARVSIITGERQNVLLVPLAAIKMNKGQQYVEVMKDGQLQKVNVVVGISSDEKVEIVSGLEQGDIIILPQPKPQPQSAAGGGPRGFR